MIRKRKTRNKLNLYPSHVVMIRVCPNCNYTRKASDTAPEWQCPACEKAYNKGSGARVDTDYGRSVPLKQPSPSGGGVFKWVLLIVLASSVAWVAHSLWPEKSAFAKSSTQRGAQPEVIMYATEWCGYCAAARQFFSDNGIRFLELDVERTSAGYEGHRKLGGNGVPIIVVGDDIVQGFDEGKLRSLLKPWMKRS